MSLRPCTSCGRHVRNHELRCPFCATTLSAVPERAAVVLPRAGRAAIMAFGAMASTATLAGCPGNPMPLYGGPPTDAGDRREDAASSTEDAGSAVDAATSDDAGMVETDTGGGMNLYGGPPTDAGQANDTGGPVPLYGGAGF
ncbi:MAG: hypothetical protein K1X94_22745 [Sandaracinaceae bacterium]|jgi:hypothetical protein|nr:hypothetical protein [Sandaracinaceae bacterium]